MLESISLVGSGVSFALADISFTPLWLEFVLVSFVERGYLRSLSVDAKEIVFLRVKAPAVGNNEESDDDPKACLDLREALSFLLATSGSKVFWALH